MLTAQRKQLILSRLATHGQIVAGELALELGTSEDTIRRDLRELAQQGKLQRVHGGALPASAATGDLRVRQQVSPDEKQALGRFGAQLIKPGQVVMLDGGTTAIQVARQNITDDRAKVWWSDARTLEAQGDKDFVVSNPPFHDGGAEDRRLGQAFIRKAAELLKKGGVAWIVANRHLPYEAELDAAFKRVRLVAEAGGYKLFEAVK